MCVCVSVSHLRARSRIEIGDFDIWKYLCDNTLCVWLRVPALLCECMWNVIWIISTKYYLNRVACQLTIISAPTEKCTISRAYDKQYNLTIYRQTRPRHKRGIGRRQAKRFTNYPINFIIIIIIMWCLEISRLAAHKIGASAATKFKSKSKHKYMRNSCSTHKRTPSIHHSIFPRDLIGGFVHFLSLICRMGNVET